jgi:hypothetical protein
MGRSDLSRLSKSLVRGSQTNSRTNSPHPKKKGYLLIYHRFLPELLKYHHFHRLFTNVPLFLYSGILVI